jgi:hypothetical protein
VQDDSRMSRTTKSVVILLIDAGLEEDAVVTPIWKPALLFFVRECDGPSGVDRLVSQPRTLAKRCWRNKMYSIARS